MDKSYEMVILRAIDYMKANLSQPLSVARIAQEVGYSDSWLSTIFRKGTGKGVLPHLLQFRIDKAKELLCETQLSISEIALEVGYNSYTRFAIAFREKERITPTAFRKAALKAGEMPVAHASAKLTGERKEWFSDNFSGTDIGSCWAVLCGEWQQQNGRVTGTAEEQCMLGFNRPLPENFRVAFDAQFGSSKSLIPSDLCFYIHDELNSRDYYQLIVGSNSNRTGEIRRSGVCIQSNPRATIKKGSWQHVAVELRDDTVSLDLDNERMFAFRDPFPPPYSNRCRFAVGSWRSIVSFRDLKIRDLGFLPLVRPVRQGDLLFNAGLFERARDFYVRHLESGLSPTDTMELRYKIGMCFLRQGALSQAKQWLGKVVTLPQSDFWAQQAKLALLEVDWQDGEVELLCQNARSLFRIRALRDGVREVMARACSDFSVRGFHQRALSLYQLLFQVEDRQSVPGLDMQLSLARCLEVLRRLEEAEGHLRRVVRSSSTPEDIVVQALINLSFVCTLQEKMTKAQDIIQQIRRRTRNLFALARCDIHEAWNLCGAGQHEDAVKLLEGVPVRYPRVGTSCALARLQAAAILCGLGKAKDARRIIDETSRTYPDQPVLSKAAKANYVYVPLLVEGRYAEAAEVLTEASRHDDNRLASRAGQAVRAGILLGLASHTEKAHSIWTETARRFPPQRCCYYGGLAQGLLSDSKDNLEEMPYPVWARSEIFYLAGLLYEARGNKGRAEELFALSMKEDPTNRWPAMLAKKKVDDKQ